MILAWHNQINSATLTSDTTWVGTLPLDNLKNYVLSKVARTTTDAAFTITALFDNAITIGCVMLCNHNVGKLGRVNIKCYNNTDLIDDSEDLATRPQASNALVSDTLFDTMRNDLVYWLPSNQAITSVEITITNTGNPDNYIELGRIFAGESYEPANGIDYGDCPISYKDLSEIVTVPSGVKYAYPQQKLRSVDLTLKYLSDSEAIDTIFDAQRRLGLVGEVVYAQLGKPTYTIISSKRAMTTAYYATCFIGNLSELSPLDQQFFNGYKTQLRIEEVAV